jgi:hypothetical protein
MVNMPPRHGKSEMCSHWFPAWFLGTHPERRVILTSYEADYASSWGRKVRDALEEHGALFGVQVSRGSSAANRWDLAGHLGGMVTAGVGGPITGRGAHLLIIDDPVKNAQEANSPTTQARNWEWYQSTAYTRLEPGGVIVCIQTRWHEADLAGMILQHATGSGERWEVLDLPAIAERDERYGEWERAAGQALWPERYDVDALNNIHRAIGDYYWLAEYQQQPQPPIGGYFWREWDTRTHLEEPFEIPAHWPRIMGLDYGYAHPTVALWGAVDTEGVVHVYDELWLRHQTVEDLSERIKERGKLPSVIGAGPDVFGLQKEQRSGPSIDKLFAQRGISLRNVTQGRRRHHVWQQVRRYLQWRDGMGDPMPGRPLLRVFRGRCPHLEEQMPLMMHNPSDMEDMLKVDIHPDTGAGGDDAVDCLGYLLMCRPWMAVDPKPAPVPGSIDFLREQERRRRAGRPLLRTRTDANGVEYVVDWKG